MIDSHCHINDKAFVSKESQYIKEAIDSGVATLLIVGCDYLSSLKAAEIAFVHKECYAAVGIHPTDSKYADEKDLERIEFLLQKEHKVIAVGEIGLDYYWEKDETIKEHQKEIFIKQIDLANKYNLPISIHCRDAYEDCLNIFKAHPVKRGGVMHCYGGSKEMMAEFIKLGFYVGIGGTVTFKNAVKIKEVAQAVPSDRYLLETDAPYLAPTPHRGEENHSKYLFFIRDQIALLRNTSPEQVDEETTKNFRTLFGL